jgi:hypothetical protein
MAVIQIKRAFLIAIALQSSGNDVFYRNPYNTDENLFVSISSPSSSKYSSVDNLKSPETAAERTKQQYLSELLSTRLGVRRTTDVVSAQERTASDNRKYYDLEVGCATHHGLPFSFLFWRAMLKIYHRLLPGGIFLGSTYAKLVVVRRP